jgi:hypothetical protein
MIKGERATTGGLCHVQGMRTHDLITATPSSKILVHLCRYVLYTYIDMCTTGIKSNKIHEVQG